MHPLWWHWKTYIWRKKCGIGKDTFEEERMEKSWRNATVTHGFSPLWHFGDSEALRWVWELEPPPLWDFGIVLLIHIYQAPCAAYTVIYCIYYGIVSVIYRRHCTDYTLLNHIAPSLGSVLTSRLWIPPSICSILQTPYCLLKPIHTTNPSVWWST